MKARRVLLTPRVESQLDALPDPAARKAVSALRILASVPHSGLPYPEQSPFRGLFYKTIVVKARRWSYRVTYGIEEDAIEVHYLYPATHPGLAGRHRDGDGDDDE